MLEKASVFNVAQIIYSSFFGSCYVIFSRIRKCSQCCNTSGEKNLLN